MSLKRKGVPPVPEETATVARAAFPKGNIYMQMRDEFGSIYTDDMFVDLYPQDGQSAISPWRLALIMVMQFAENLTDRQAADAVRDRIAWKYALSLKLTDAGFDYSVLSEFRQRLVEHEAGHRLLDEMLQQFTEKGLMKTRGQQRTDATHVLAAIRKLNQLELVHETLRHALNVLAAVASTWLKIRIDGDWFDRYSKRTSNYLLPEAETERLLWAEVVGQDGWYILEQVYQGDGYTRLAELPAMETLRQVWMQNYYLNQGRVCLREKKNQPPSAQRITSPYDIEARCATKRDTTWIGYKVHMTETCDPTSPNLITEVETRPATEHDVNAVDDIHDELRQADRLPQEHLVDASYVSADTIVSSRDDYGVDLVGPVGADSSWQARAEDGLDLSHFRIDWDQHAVTCPQDKTSRSWVSYRDPRGYDTVKIKFRRSDCADCSARSRCTRSQTAGRTLTIPSQTRYEALQSARQRQQTPEFKQKYAVRAGVEGTVSQVVFALGRRRTRYRGLAKTHLQHIATAAAMNLMRVIAWLNKVPRSITRQSHFARLAT